MTAQALWFGVMKKEDTGCQSFYVTSNSRYIKAWLDGSIQSLWGHFHVAIKFVLLCKEGSLTLLLNGSQDTKTSHNLVMIILSLS